MVKVIKREIEIPRPLFPSPKTRFSRTRISVFVPSTTAGNRKITNKQFKKRVITTRSFMHKTFGGTTKVTGEGTFTFQKGKLRGKIGTEKVAKVESYVFNDKFNVQNRAKLTKFLDQKQKAWQQEALAVEFQSPKKKRAIHFIE
jgi:hypothetical protein